MFKCLIVHQWKELVRSILWKRSIGVNIFLGILLVLLALNLLSFGLFVDQIISQAFPDENPVLIINSFIIYYLLIDLVVRHFLQRGPGFTARGYMILPVKRANIVNYLLLKSLLSFFNFLPLLLMIPVCFKLVVPAYGLLIGFGWLTGVYTLILNNNFIYMYLSRQSLVKTFRVLGFLVLLALIAVTDFLGIVKLSFISQFLFSLMLSYPIIVLVFIYILYLSYRLNFNLFSRHFYMDNAILTDSIQQSIKFDGRLSYLHSFGHIGSFIALEIKLLLRNKRARATLLMSLALIPLGTYVYYAFSTAIDFYPQPSEESLNKAHQPLTSSGQKMVTFKVRTDSLPEDAHVYITGDHPKLGPWKPKRLPLTSPDKKNWERTFAFGQGTKLRYIYTLGSWATEMRKVEVHEPEVKTLTVQADTTVFLTNPFWKIPQRPVFIDGFLIYMGLLMVGMLMISYGSFMFSWESGYFDSLLTRNLDLYAYLRAKFILLIIFAVIFYILVIPFALFDSIVLYINTMALIYNIGVNSFVLFYLVTFSRKRFDLSASVFSTQGKGSNQFTAILPTIIAPVLVYLPFGLSGYSDLGIVFLGVLGLCGILANKFLMRFIIRTFQKRKYQMAAGFRQP